MKFRATRHRIYRGITICSGLIYITLTLHAEVPQRPKPPAGYSWQECPDMGYAPALTMHLYCRGTQPITWCLD